MKVLSTEKTSIHPLHESVEHIAGPECAGRIIGGGETGQILPKLLEFLYHEPGYSTLCGPFTKPADSLRKRGFGFGTIAVPQLFRNGSERLFVLLGGTISYADKDMKETHEECDAWKDGLPCIARREPSVSVSRLGAVNRIERLRLLLEYTVSLFQVLLTGTGGDARAQDAAFCDRCSTVDLVATEPCVFLIGHYMARQQRGILDSGPDNTESPKTSFHSVPVHRVSPVAIGQRPVRYVELSEEQGLFDILDQTSHIRHGEGGTYRVAHTTYQNPADPHVQPFRIAYVLHLKVALKAIKEQAFVVLNRMVHSVSETIRVLDQLCIFLLGKWQTNRSIFPGSIRTVTLSHGASVAKVGISQPKMPECHEKRQRYFVAPQIR